MCKIRICTLCKESLPATLEYFGKEKKGKYGLRSRCRECRSKHEYGKNKEYILAKRKEYYKENKEKMNKDSKEWKLNNAERYRKVRQVYYIENMEYIKVNVKKNMYKRLENDIEFRIYQRCRTRLYNAVKRHTKSARTKELIGCTTKYLLNHLEKQFTIGMTWDNYGDWHIDHIKPCVLFDFSKEEEQRECFNYMNLQPLWAEDNYRKSDKY